MKTILIVDSDLGFLAHLSKSLSAAGYLALPATTSQTAIPLLEELENSKVDLLMVNFALPSTADLVTTLKERNQLLKIIAVEDPRRYVDTNVPVDVSLRKPYPSGSPVENEWLVTLTQLLGDE